MEATPPPHDAGTPHDPARPPIAEAPLSVILLALGTDSDAAESVSAWQAYLPTLERPFEIVVVQSGAPHVNSNPVLAEVRRIEIDPVVGIGPALQAAVNAAQHPLVALAPADRQFEPRELQALRGVIDHADLAVGCRNVPRPFWLSVLGWVFAILIRIVLGIPPYPRICTPGATPWRRRWAARWGFGVRLCDPESPFRLGRRESLARIVLQSQGTFALVEQLAKANHLEMMMTEEPVSWASPAMPIPERVPFAQEARALMRRPDFGPVELHVRPPAPEPALESTQTAAPEPTSAQSSTPVPTPAPTSAPAPENPQAIPTKPEAPSS
jgi:hypothetical protein